MNIGTDAGAIIAYFAMVARRAAKVRTDIAVATGFGRRIADHLVDAALGDGARLADQPFQTRSQIGGARRQIDQHCAPTALAGQVVRRFPV